MMAMENHVESLVFLLEPVWSVVSEQEIKKAMETGYHSVAIASMVHAGKPIKDPILVNHVMELILEDPQLPDMFLMFSPLLEIKLDDAEAKPKDKNNEDKQESLCMALLIESIRRSKVELIQLLSAYWLRLTLPSLIQVAELGYWEILWTWMWIPENRLQVNEVTGMNLLAIAVRQGNEEALVCLIREHGFMFSDMPISIGDFTGSVFEWAYQQGRAALARDLVMMAGCPAEQPILDGIHDQNGWKFIGRYFSLLGFEDCKKPYLQAILRAAIDQNQREVVVVFQSLWHDLPFDMVTEAMKHHYWTLVFHWLRVADQGLEPAMLETCWSYVSAGSLQTPELFMEFLYCLRDYRKDPNLLENLSACILKAHGAEREGLLQACINNKASLERCFKQEGPEKLGHFWKILSELALASPLEEGASDRVLLMNYMMSQKRHRSLGVESPHNPRSKMSRSAV